MGHFIFETRKRNMGQVEEDNCAQCHLEIKGSAMKAKGQLYCAATCFRCVVCSVDLKEIPVFCKDDGLFCEDCYKEKYVPRCCKCNGYITEECRCTFEGQKSFYAIDNQPICGDCA